LTCSVIIANDGNVETATFRAAAVVSTVVVIVTKYGFVLATFVGVASVDGTVIVVIAVYFDGNTTNSVNA